MKLVLFLIGLTMYATSALAIVLTNGKLQRPELAAITFLVGVAIMIKFRTSAGSP